MKIPAEAPVVHAAAPPSPARPGRPAFSRELEALGQKFSGRPVRLGELLAATRGRGYNLLLLLIALPFVSPLPLPGFSIPFGVVVAFIGLRLALNRRFWLPAWLRQRELPAQFLAKLFRAAGRLMKGLEFFLRSRLVFINDWFIFQRLAGLLIAISGCYLILPLPLPFSNSLPAWTVLLLAAGSLGRDGLLLILGTIAFGVSTAYFLLVALGGFAGWEWLYSLPVSG